MHSFWIFLAWAVAAILLLPQVLQAFSRRIVALEALLAKRLEDFHVFIQPSSLRALIILTLFASLFVSVLGFRSLVIFPVVAVLAFLGIFAVVRVKLAKRLKVIRYQLPGVIELVATSLRAGLSIRAALFQVSRQSSNPIAQELAILERMQRIGIPLTAALAEWAKRIPIDDIRLIGFTIGVSSASGGNLADALDRLAHTCRQRLIVEEKMDALTAQGRLQAWVMIALPFLLALALTFIDPSSMNALWTTSAGHFVIALMLALELLGMLWIRRLIVMKD